MITEDMMSAMQGIIPASIVTCNRDGVPNSTYISQVHYVDDNHVALSFQFFNKTKRNVMENPFAAVDLTAPHTYRSWSLQLQFERSETEGPIYEEMEMQLEAIASMTGMAGVFKLHAADIYKVTGVKRVF